MKLEIGKYPEQGTLKEIGARVGDVVRGEYKDFSYQYTIGKISGNHYYEENDSVSNLSDLVTWRIISRASDKPASPVRTVTRKEIVPGGLWTDHG